MIFALGDTTQNQLVAPGCTLLVGGRTNTGLAIANGAGLASFSVPIPSSASLLGLVAVAQAGVVGPAASGLVDLSNALRITLGH